MSHAISTFFTSYTCKTAGRADERVEAIALMASEGPGTEPLLRVVVVDQEGRLSVVPAEDVDLRELWEPDDVPNPSGGADGPAG